MHVEVSLQTEVLLPWRFVCRGGFVADRGFVAVEVSIQEMFVFHVGLSFRSQIHIVYGDLFSESMI